MVIIAILAFILTCLIIDAIIKNYNKKSKEIVNSTKSEHCSFNENSILFPKGLFYDKTHTWSFMQENGTVRIGVDDFLLHITGTINKIKIKKSGDKIVKGEHIFSIIQNGKQLNINAPISGVIKSYNSHLLENPEIINYSPFIDGWIYNVEPSNWNKDIKFLILAEKYKEFLKNEITRLKDYLSSSKLLFNNDISFVVLQDGGELKDNLLEDFSPEAWEEFQVKYLNS